MKIIIFSWRDIKHPSAGGAEIATHEHAKYWVKNGHEVIVFSSSFDGASTEDIIDGVKFVRRGNQLGSVYIHAFVWYLRLFDKPDVVVDQIHGIGFLTPLYVRVPILVYIHEVAKEVWFLNHLRFPLNYIYGVFGYCLEPFMFKLLYIKSDFMTVSESTKRDLISMDINPNKITVIPNGTTPVVSKYKKNIEKTAIYLGAIAKDKGIVDAINSFSKIYQTDHSWKFWIVGKGDPDLVSSLKQLVDDLGIARQTTFFGYVSDNRKYELLSKAHVMINPSRHEGWGLVNLEANMVGTPVVGYNVSGTKDSVIHNKTGILCEYGDYIGLSENALFITDSESKYSEFSINAVKWSRNFTWQKSTIKSLKLIKSL